MKYFLSLVCAVLSLGMAAVGRGQSDVDGFDPGANNSVSALAVQHDDGKILVGGSFTTLGGGGFGETTRNHVGRVNPDGTLDVSFDPGANGLVLALATQADSKILAGGSFTTLGGGGMGQFKHDNIGRLNADGTIDPAFNPTADGPIQALAVQADGKIVIGGNFFTLNGQAHKFIARLNSDGTVDATFNPIATDQVFALALQPDGKIVVGTGLAGVASNNIGRLNPDGTTDTNFHPGANSTVNSLALQADGKIVAGGNFTSLGGATRNRIGRLNLDGTLDTGFDPGADSGVFTLAVQADGKILAGGFFTTLGGGGTGTTTRNRIGRLNQDGTLDNSFDPGANSTVFALALELDGKIVVAGGFTTLGGGGTGMTTRNFIGRLSTGAPPVITSPLSSTTTVGPPFVYQFEASGAISLDVTGLPAGLTFDPLLSAIVGTSSVTGTFDVGLSATNSDGTTTATLTLTLQPAPASGPVIISGTSATGRTGEPFSFQVITSGASAAARLTATGLPAGLSVDPVTGIISGTAATNGSSAVVLTVTDGSLRTTATLELTFSSDPALPVIVSPSEVTLVAGIQFTYQIVAPTSDPSDPVTYDLIGTLPPGLSFDPVTGIISGVFQPRLGLQPSPLLSGGIVTNVQLFTTNSHGTGTIPLVFFVKPTGALNISTRLAVGLGDNALFGGFIVTGNAPKKVIIRAIGPSLTVQGKLLDPILELHDSSGLLGSNDDWRDSQEQEIIDTTIPPTDDRESAIVATLAPFDSAVPGSGAYTVIVRGNNPPTGVALVEIYDLGTASFDISSQAQLANISTRGYVQTGDNVMFGGFILGGGDTATVLLRAIGPELTVPGALSDTVLELYNSDADLLAANDDWESDQKQKIIDTGVPPTDPRESAIVAELNPGSYTGIVRGKDNTTGVALVEVYVLQ